MKANVQWAGRNRFIATSEGGHALVMDANKGETAPSPMDMVLMSAGSCSSVDVVSILQKARQDITDVEVELTAERADDVPAVFTDIHLHFVVTGRGVSDKHVERAVDLSAEKYCSVAIMLSKAVNVTHSFEIKEQE